MFNYQLLDCGNEIKQERFGDIIINRPAYQATFKNKIPLIKADFSFDKKNNWQQHSEKNFDNFSLKINNEIQIILKKSRNGQLGIFPEQYKNWIWLNEISKKEKKPLRILNCFAYTGISTLFCARNNPNGKNIHLDGSKSIVNWAKKNSKISKLDNNNIFWIVDDVISFLKREIKRGKKYDGFILDPPAFGRGPKGKIWKFSKDIKELFTLISKLISENPAFILVSAHDAQMNSIDLKSMLHKILKLPLNEIEHGKLKIHSKKGNDLESGYFARWNKK